MIKTLVGKVDGDVMLAIKEDHQMDMSGDPLVDDIVEVLGRIYICRPGENNAIFYEDVTHAFNGGET